MSQRLPALFVSHGAPTLFVEPQPTRAFLQGLGASLPKPNAVLCVSAHWTSALPLLSLNAKPETIHDFFGFPQELYEVEYPAPGSPELAGQVLELLAQAGIEAAGDSERGLDHGAWVPLGLMYPEADIPVVQLSVMPGWDAARHLALGRALAPLRERGVLLLASGSATHNLAGLDWRAAPGQAVDYAADFEAWLVRAVKEKRDHDLTDYLRQAPQARKNHPTPEHILPLFVALGLGGEPRVLQRDFTFGALSMAAFAWD